MTRQDNEEEENALIDILKTVVEECMSIYKKVQIKAPSNRTSKIQGISFIMEEEEEDRAGINVMPKSLFEHLKLADLKKTSMVVEMADMTKKAPLGIVENILVKIDKFLFHFDFVVIDMLEGLNEIMLLGTPSCSKESIDTVDLSHDMHEIKGSQDDEVGSHLLENESGMLKQWICFRDHERQNVRGNGMIFVNFLKVRAIKYAPYDFHHEYPQSYIPQKIDSPPNDTLRINTYFPDIFRTQLKKLRLRDNSFEEWVKIKLGHTNVSETIKYEMYKEWIKDNFNFEVDFGMTRDDPYSRRFDVYKEEFDNEIEQLENEYELKAGRKRYTLDKVWEKCEKFHNTTKIWYDKGFEEEELCQNGIKEIDYTPPLVKRKTFEVHQYTFKNRKSFINITKQMDDVLTLGRVNGSRFIEKTRKEMEEGMRTTRKM
uniref:Phospholipase-like protein n=1 Tax=Tanacetum cinerariifolium TaxID=118510 RepID=A0A699GU39_TANCI|nr:phospholipase-like protein [Tanacetum cinerariifolium]